MSDQQAPEFKLPQEMIDQLAVKLLDAWLRSDSSYDFQNVVKQAAFDRLKQHPIIQEITDAVIAQLQERKMEIVRRIAEEIVAGTTRALGSVYGEIARKVGEHVAKTHIY